MQKGFATKEEFEKELNKLPDLNIFQQHLTTLTDLDKSNYSLIEIRKAFFEYAILLPNSLSTLPKDTINLLTAYRVRLNIKEEEDFDLIRTFSYPNPCFCTANGRANLKRKSVFYCADTFETAFAESKPNKGEIAYLSIWKINCDRDINYSAFFPANIPAKNVWYNTAIEQQKHLVEYARNIGNDKSKQLELLFQFISELFGSETSPYYLTSWIANSVLYEYHGIDFVVYPSFITKGVTCNIAFHPNFVDNNFRLDRIFKLIVTEINENGGKYTIEKVGKVLYTNIQWGPPNEADIQEYFPNALKSFKEKE